MKQEPPLPVAVELSSEAGPDERLAEAIREKLRSTLVQTQEASVPFGSLARSEYKSHLVQR